MKLQEDCAFCDRIRVTFHEITSRLCFGGSVPGRTLSMGKPSQEMRPRYAVLTGRSGKAENSDISSSRRPGTDVMIF
jgi:hypothetical protein